MRKSFLLVVIGSLLGMGCQEEEPIYVPGPQEFGHESYNVTGALALGERPLLTVLLNAPPSEAKAPFSQPAEFYEKMIFGDEEGRANTRSFFLEMSKGLFTWKNIGVFGPADFDTGGFETHEDFEYRIQQAVDVAAAAGLDFAQFDTDHDGRVEGNELGLLFIDNHTRTGGAVRGSSETCARPAGQTIQVCGRFATAGVHFGAATLAHELSHLLGTHDLYGHSCNSMAGTLMSCTGVENYEFYPRTMHLDPWHKMVLGWREPRVRTLDQGVLDHIVTYDTARFSAVEEQCTVPVLDEAPEDKALFLPTRPSDPLPAERHLSAGEREAEHLFGCAELMVPNGQDTEASRPVILSTEGGGTREYFMLEYRNPYASVYFDGERYRSYDNWAGDRGLAIWMIVTDENGHPAAIPNAYRPEKQDPGVVLVGASNQLRGYSTFWTEFDGTQTLLTVEGQSSGIKVRAGPLSSGDDSSILVEWGMGGLGIERIDAAEKYNPEVMRVRGFFGAELGERQIQLISLDADGAPQDLEATAWGCGEIFLRLKNGGPLPSGRVQIRVGTAAMEAIF